MSCKGFREGLGFRAEGVEGLGFLLKELHQGSRKGSIRVLLSV